MQIFVSYSRHDEEVIKQLVRGLSVAHKDVWYDFELDGGEIWWTRILEAIRECTVFIFALSDHSLQSKACMEEYGYAVALRKQVVPVLVGKIGMELANPLAKLQVVGYRPDEAEAGFQVLAAVDAAARRAVPLPEVLPPEPKIPHEYLRALAQQIDADQLGHTQQEDVVEQLRKALRIESDPDVRQQVLLMLRNLKDRRWITKQTEREIQTVLLMEDPETPSVAVVPPAAPGSMPAPEGSQTTTPTRRGAGPPAEEPDGQALFEQYMTQVRSRLEQEQERKVDDQWSADDWQGTTATRRGAASSASSRHAPIWRGVTPEPEPPPPPQPRPVQPLSFPAPPPPIQPFPPQPGPTVYVPPVMPVVQPYPPPAAYGVIPPQRVSPPNYWALSIVAFFLSLLFGGIAMYFSYQVGQRFNAHDDDGALRASRNAKTWGIVGIIVGAIFFLAYAGSR